MARSHDQPKKTRQQKEGVGGQSLKKKRHNVGESS